MKSTDRQKKTRKLAVSAMLCALGVVFMYFGAVAEMFDLTTVAVASVFLLFAMAELGSPYSYLIYAVTSVLSLLLLPNKTAGLIYLLFGGVYPFFMRLVSRFPVWLACLLKFVYFNGILCILLWVTLTLFRIQDTGLGFNYLTFILGNVAFFAYDVALSRLSWLYSSYLRRRFRVERFFH